MSNYMDNGFQSPAHDYADSFASEFNAEMERRGVRERMPRDILVKGFERLGRLYGWSKVKRICERSYLQPFFDDMDSNSLAEIPKKPEKLDDVYNAVFGWEAPRDTSDMTR